MAGLTPSRAVNATDRQSHTAAILSVAQGQDKTARSHMYRPSSFDETDTTRLFDAIEAYSFGVLAAQDGDEIEASHLPLLLDRERGERGMLYGHMARANPLWRIADGNRVLAVFSGPHAYISPTWYGEPNTVPTWNYVAIHVHGHFRAIHADDEILRILVKSVAIYEAGQSTPWTIDLDAELLAKLVKGIVGFTIEIDKIEGKWKLGQNRSLESRERVAEILTRSEEPATRQIGELMRPQ